jgi:hypothetical protein
LIFIIEVCGLERLIDLIDSMSELHEDKSALDKQIVTVIPFMFNFIHIGNITKQARKEKTER